MKFEDAMKILRAGGKVRLPSWAYESYIYAPTDGGTHKYFYNNSGSKITLSGSEAFQDSWEEFISEDDKRLAAKLRSAYVHDSSTGFDDLTFGGKEDWLRVAKVAREHCR